MFSISSCSSRKASSESTEKKETSESNGSNDSDFAKFDPGVYKFVEGYMYSKKHFEPVVGTSTSKSPKIPDEYSKEMLRYEIQSDNILDNISCYLFPDGDSANEVTGKHVLLGCNCFKKKEGERILFGYKHTFEKDRRGHLAGDISSENGSFDTSKKYLLLEDCITRNGSIYRKVTTELLLLDDGTYIMQHFWLHAESSKVTCTFVKLNENTKTLTAYLCEGKSSGGYTFASLSDAKDMSIDELSKDYIINFIIKAENGKATYKKNEKAFS